MRNRSLFAWFTIVLMSQLNFSTSVLAREGINLYLGCGFPDMISAGVRIQADQVQFGAGYGFVPGYEERAYSLSGDLFYHFGGSTEFSERRPWFVRAGVIYTYDETPSKIFKYSYLPLRVGRDFNFSQRVGFVIDLGAMFLIAEKEEVKQPSYSGFRIDLYDSILPCISVGFFIRIGKI